MFSGLRLRRLLLGLLGLALVLGLRLRLWGRGLGTRDVPDHELGLRAELAQLSLDQGPRDRRISGEAHLLAVVGGERRDVRILDGPDGIPGRRAGVVIGAGLLVRAT